MYAGYALAGKMAQKGIIYGQSVSTLHPAIRARKYIMGAHIKRKKSEE